MREDFFGTPQILKNKITHIHSIPLSLSLSLSLSLTSDRLCPGLAYPPSASLSCSDSWVTDITSPPTVTNGRVVGRVHWMRGEEGWCLSQAHGIHDILYWVLCWKGENQLHHPYKWPGLMKVSFVLFFFLSSLSDTSALSFITME